MPDKDGKLTKAEQDKIVSWMNERGKHHPCPHCQVNSWGIGEHLLSGSVFRGGALYLGGPSYPQVLLICNNCAYVRTFMAVPILGVDGLKLEDPNPEKKAEGEPVAEKKAVSDAR